MSRRSPSDRRRETRRALAKAKVTSALIQHRSRVRQQARAGNEANRAAGLDTDLRLLYYEFGDDKRGVFAAGIIPDGTPFRGRTWRAR